MSPSAFRIFRGALLLPLLTVPLAAQRVPAPRIAHQANQASQANSIADRAAFLAELERESAVERAAPAIPGQLFAGFAGMIVGAAVGTTSGLLFAYGSETGSGVETVLVLATLGGVLGGTTFGVYRFSKAKGANGKALATFGGAALGLLGGPAVWVTVPLGARWGYNRSRTDAPQ